MALGKFVEELYEQVQNNLQTNRSDYEEQIDYRGYYLKQVRNVGDQKPESSLNQYSAVRHWIIKQYGYYI